MSDHSPEPWRSSEPKNGRILDNKQQLIADIYGGTRTELLANEALMLAAPAMKRKLTSIMTWLNTVYTGPPTTWAETIQSLLATTEPDKPPTLLKACTLALEDAETYAQPWSGVRRHLVITLRDAIAAEEARDADHKTT